MSIQADGTGNGNKPVKTTVSGLAKDTGTPVTPAPTKRAAPDEVTNIRAPSRAGYGMNGFQGGSSLPPGVGGPQSPLGQNMADSVNDPVLGEILSKGTARSNTTGDTQGAPQTRDVGKSGLPDSMGMESARARQPSSGKFSAIPATLQHDDRSPGEIVGRPDPGE